jgi:hypothetical protein
MSVGVQQAASSTNRLEESLIYVRFGSQSFVYLGGGSSNTAPKSGWEKGPQIEIEHFGLGEVTLSYVFHDYANQDIWGVFGELVSEEGEIAC